MMKARQLDIPINPCSAMFSRRPIYQQPKAVLKARKLKLVIALSKTDSHNPVVQEDGITVK